MAYVRLSPSGVRKFCLSVADEQQISHKVGEPQNVTLLPNWSEEKVFLTSLSLTCSHKPSLRAVRRKRVWIRNAKSTLQHCFRK